MDKNMITRGRCLVDLVAGKLPTFSGWTVDPTDAVDITDGDILSVCNTGNKVCGAGYQYGIMEYDLGGQYDVLVTGSGGVTATAGSGLLMLGFYTPDGWHNTTQPCTDSSGWRPFMAVGTTASKLQLRFMSTAAATIEPNMRSLNVWRL